MGLFSNNQLKNLWKKTEENGIKILELNDSVVGIQDFSKSNQKNTILYESEWTEVPSFNYGYNTSTRVFGSTQALLTEIVKTVNLGIIPEEYYPFINVNVIIQDTPYLKYISIAEISAIEAEDLSSSQDPEKLATQAYCYYFDGNFKLAFKGTDSTGETNAYNWLVPPVGWNPEENYAPMTSKYAYVPTMLTTSEVKVSYTKDEVNYTDTLDSITWGASELINPTDISYYWEYGYPITNFSSSSFTCYVRKSVGDGTITFEPYIFPDEIIPLNPNLIIGSYIYNSSSYNAYVNENPFSVGTGRSGRLDTTSPACSLPYNDQFTAKYCKDHSLRVVYNPADINYIEIDIATCAGKTFKDVSTLVDGTCQVSIRQNCYLKGLTKNITSTISYNIIDQSFTPITNNDFFDKETTTVTKPVYSIETKGIPVYYKVIISCLMPLEITEKDENDVI